MTTPAEMTMIQPPVGGLNWRKPPIELDPREALHLENILPKPSSGELRAGYQQFATNLGNPVKTVMVYRGRHFNDSKLFAVTSDGSVFDVTAGGDTFESTTKIGTTGVVSYVNSVTQDNSYLCAVDPAGGYWLYDTVNGWVNEELTGDGAGKSFSSIFKWKDRIWLIETDSTKAYYLDIGAIKGAATVFDFAPIMRRGGHLAFGANWTFDAGYDLNDYFVLVSTQGEVMVYEGINPSEASTFSLKGVWNVGRVPNGDRCHVHFGGELFLMSSLGVVPMSKLVNGAVANEYDVASSKIQPVLEGVFNQLKDQFGWEMVNIYDQAFLLLKVPQRTSGQHIHYVMSTQTGAWGTITNMPMQCTALLDESLYFGTEYGTVCKGFVGDTDNQKLDKTPGAPIVGRYLGGYQDYDKPGRHKVFTLCRPFFVATASPSSKVRISTQYSARLPTVESQSNRRSTDAIFGTDKWNQCAWSGGTNTYTSMNGVNGMGYYGAVAMAFTGPAATQFVSASLMYQVGGVL